MVLPPTTSLLFSMRRMRTHRLLQARLWSMTRRHKPRKSPPPRRRRSQKLQVRFHLLILSHLHTLSQSEAHQNAMGVYAV